MVAGAKVMTGTILDLLTEPDRVQKTRAKFEGATKTASNFEVPPPDAKPPLDLNKELANAQVLPGRVAATELIAGRS
jgi:aminobenzoyl-glutamate utilization protein B